MHFMYKMDNLFRSIRVSDENSSVTKGTSFFRTYYNSRLFMRSLRSIQSHVVNFQPFLASFAIFHPFTDLFLELHDREIEKHYKMNFEKVETWHGIIISPTLHVQNSREAYGENWMHFVYKLDNLFRSMRVSDEKTHLLKTHFIFFNLLQLRTFFVFGMHDSRQRHRLSTLSSIICYFSFIY